MTIIWKRLDHPGHEWCRLRREGGNWTLTGVVVLSYKSTACSLAYTIRCDSAWETRSVSITGSIGKRTISMRVSVDRRQRWTLNGKRIEAVSGCRDVDLGFSPSTNLLPIRRLGLSIGQPVQVRAAWIEFPSMKVKPLEQVYRRDGAQRVRYESAGGRFVRELTVSPQGFVTEYPGLWVAEISHPYAAIPLRRQ